MVSITTAGRARQESLPLKLTVSMMDQVPFRISMLSGPGGGGGTIVADMAIVPHSSPSSRTLLYSPSVVLGRVVTASMKVEELPGRIDSSILLPKG